MALVGKQIIAKIVSVYVSYFKCLSDLNYFSAKLWFQVIFCLASEWKQQSCGEENPAPECLVSLLLTQHLCARGPLTTIVGGCQMEKLAKLKTQ